MSLLSLATDGDLFAVEQKRLLQKATNKNMPVNSKISLERYMARCRVALIADREE